MEAALPILSTSVRISRENIIFSQLLIEGSSEIVEKKKVRKNTMMAEFHLTLHA